MWLQPIARKLSLFIGQTEDRKLPDILTQSLQDFRFFRNRRWTEPKNKKKMYSVSRLNFSMV